MGKKYAKNQRKNPLQVFFYTLAVIALSCVCTLTLILIRSSPAGLIHSLSQKIPTVMSAVLPRKGPQGTSQGQNQAEEASEPVDTLLPIASPERTIPAQSPAARPERTIPEKALVLVIDDVGYNLQSLEPYLRYPGPLTIAVLPGLAYSAEAARRVRAAGKELLLHQPMEALGGEDPGPMALYSGMGTEEVRAIIAANLDEIGPVAGINNHQGSLITADAAIMADILMLCQERGIYFLDSKTTADTAAPIVAARLGLAIGERNVFLDNEPDRESMLRYLNAALAYADSRGNAVMIGHVWSAALAPLLLELYPTLIDQGYSFTTVATLQESTRLQAYGGSP